MKTLFITGDGLRHRYIVYKFSRFFKNFKWIVEKRPLTTNHKKFSKNKLYLNHIKNFKSLEKKYFSKYNFKNKNIIKIIKRSRSNNKSFNIIIKDLFVFLYFFDSKI